MGCCLGGDDGEEAKNAKAKANETTPLNSKTKGQDQKEESKEAKKEAFIQFESGKSKKKLPFYVQTPIIQKNNNELILLYTEKQTTSYSIINTTDAKLKESVEIKCDKDFNVYNTSYAFNKNDGKIYFIEQQENAETASILTLDLEENEIVSLNKTITTCNGNYASIIYNDAKQKLYILGAEEKSDEDDSYELIPYAPFTVDKGVDDDGSAKLEPKLKAFGRFSRALNVTQDGKEYIYVFGGVTKSGNYLQPNDTLLIYQLDDQKYLARYTAQPIFKMGAINYDNKFIITLGGTIMKNHKEEDGAKNIYVLPLTDEKKGKEIGKEYWYELAKKLKVKGKSWGHRYFSAVLIDGIIHIVSYGGKYYTMKMKSILDEIDVGLCKDQQSGIISLHEWTQQGKTVTPTKDANVKPMGPKKDGNESD